MGPTFRDFLWKKQFIRAAHPVCMSSCTPLYAYNNNIIQQMCAFQQKLHIFETHTPSVGTCFQNLPQWVYGLGEANNLSPALWFLQLCCFWLTVQCIWTCQLTDVHSKNTYVRFFAWLRRINMFGLWWWIFYTHYYTSGLKIWFSIWFLWKLWKVRSALNTGRGAYSNLIAGARLNLRNLSDFTQNFHISL